MPHPSWHLLWLGVLGLLAWARWLVPWWLLLASGAVLLALLLPSRPFRNRPLLAAGGLTLLLGILAGFGGQLHLRQLTRSPSRALESLEVRVSEVLDRRFGALLEAGDRAVEDGLALLDRSDGEELLPGLSRIQRATGVSALAVYEPGGRLRGWVGMHRGTVPPAARSGDAPYAFAGGPLFRYLYFTAIAPGTGETVVAAALLQAKLPVLLDGEDFVSRIRRSTGVGIEILAPYRVWGPAVWDLFWAGEPLLSVSLAEPSLGALQERARLLWTRLLAFLGLGAWLLLALGGRGSPGHRLGSSVTLLAGALLLPAGLVWPSSFLVSPGHFLLPGPLEATLGRLLSVLLALGVIRGLLPGWRWGRGPALAGAAGVSLLFPLGEGLLRQAPSHALFAGGTGGWLAYQISLALLLSLLAGAVLGVAGGRRSPGRQGWLLAGCAFLSLALALAAALPARAGPGISPWLLALWGLPAYLALRGLGSEGNARRRALSWGAAVLLGSSAALPAAWGSQVEARMRVAEGELEELGAGADPFLEFRLHRLAALADSLDPWVASPVDLLFESWSLSHEGKDPLAMWLTLWSPGDLPREELALGVRGPRPPVARDFLEAVREEGVPLVRHLGMVDARYLVLLPLEGRRVLSGIVPPRRTLASPLGPLLVSLGPLGAGPLDLVPILPGEDPRVGTEVRWSRTREGWRGERVVSYPDGLYHANYSIALPGTLHAVARGTLTLLLNLVLLLFLGGVGRTLAWGGEMEVRQAGRLLRTFRARVTLALFGFFLLSIAIFGSLAFRTLSGAAQRTATALAERIVEDGAGFYLEVQGSMQLLARQVGADLLEYRGGELRGGSSAELVELGLYEGWIPEPIYRELAGRREVRATVLSSLGRWEYAVAYRRLPDGDILATPVPLEAGATALRRQEVTDLLGFAIVLGAALSLALALLVGRTLARPIQILQVASERVGAGNLRVRLPEDRKDEFGAVFGAFNRMVERIRRARRALIRTTRRTQAIVEEAATGVVALDASGRVTLVNPRAEGLLGEAVSPGEPLPGREGRARELVRWVDLYFRDGLREASTELQMGERRIRIRARRVSREDPPGGAVLSLEDVTDELRTERILAWGEMAQQVAHEVKNPLTPMKLSVQHLSRAWEDRRGDFGEILERNVEVILREIEHLAAIARSFSRIGAPRAAGEAPLEPVRVLATCQEVLNLYRGGKGALTFDCTVPEDLPPVRSREPELREVLINLLENSRVAIPEEGRVVIEARAGDDTVELSVRDDGTGIPPGLLPRVFEPHFSTRSTGTGLGLAIVRRLVESWGGLVTAESQEGEGTVVRMTLLQWKGSGKVGGSDLRGPREEGGLAPWS